MDVVADSFLATYEWRRVRMMALKKYGARCQCCGASPADGAVMNVDHIKPRRIFPYLALDLDNLQVLCHDCNHGKGNWDMTDWRKPVVTDGPPWDEDEKQQVRHLREILRGS
jgi:5-methylcytosine-specific restriction endonuclease McrA